MSQSDIELKAQRRTNRAVKILKDNDKLNVIKRGTVGYTIALGAVEAALKQAEDREAAEDRKLQVAGHFINVTINDKPSNKWEQAAEEFKKDPDVHPLYRKIK